MDKSKILGFLLLLSSNLFAQNNAKAFFSMPMEQTFFRRYANPIEDSLVVSSTITDDRISADDKFELFLASKYPNEKATQIQLVHKLSSSNLGEDFITVKYLEIKDTLALGLFTKVFQVENEAFKEVPNNKVGQLYEAIKFLKTEAFRSFLNPEPTDIPEIDKIKAQFKDAEGILDIDKLGAYLKTKPASLAKYCDY
jgi:hypothetical protein